MADNKQKNSKQLFFVDEFDFNSIKKEESKKFYQPNPRIKLDEKLKEKRGKS
jgi:hypothetical protein